jgi:acyl-coenzyme A thioesterase PaaI-like protein
MEDKSFLRKFIASNPVPQDAMDHFSSNPRTAPYLSNPLYVAIPTFSRVLKPTGEDFFFSQTVKTPQTIPHQITLQLRDLQIPEAEAGSPYNRTTQSSHKTLTPVPAYPDTIMLLRLGSPGLDGHPGIMHGGMLCAILDENMGLCVMLHRAKETGPRESFFTANLNTTYRAAVPTPSDVIVRCWLVKKDGRKWYTRGQVVNEEGVVMTEAEGLWISTKRKEAKI